MDVTIFIFFNVVVFGSFIYARKSNDYPFLFYGVGGLFSLFLVLGLVSGVKYCCGTSLDYSIPTLISGFMIPFYAIIALGLFVLASVSYKNKDFTGGL